MAPRICFNMGARLPQRPQPSSSAAARPANVALLLGWLGCRPELGQLRAYEALYSRLGWDAVVSLAAPPSAVVDSIVVSPATASSGRVTETAMKAGWGWNRGQMERVAARVLTEAESRVPRGGGGSLVVHSFSNGGCFLYEELRRQTLRRGSWCGKSLVGLVFDSCPAWHDPAQSDVDAGGGLGSAMSFCTTEEQEWFADRMERIRQVEEAGGSVDADDDLRSTRREMESHRRDEFWDGMMDDPCGVPQLYIYSENDELTPSDPLRRLIQYRKERFEKVLELKFRDSPHCRHLQVHPEEYGTALEEFLRLCLDERNTRDGAGLHRSSL